MIRDMLKILWGIALAIAFMCVVIGLVFLGLISLTGCVLSPDREPDVTVTPDCPALPDEQSDSAGIEVQHFHNCVLDTLDPKPPRAPN